MLLLQLAYKLLGSQRLLRDGGLSADVLHLIASKFDNLGDQCIGAILVGLSRRLSCSKSKH